MKYRFKKFEFIFSLLPPFLLVVMVVLAMIGITGPISYKESFIDLCIQFAFPSFILAVTLPLIVPNIILAKQYLKCSQNVELDIDKNSISLFQIDSGLSTTILKSDIKEIVYVRSALTRPFAYYSYLAIITNEGSEVIIPEFLIEKEIFFKHFGEYRSILESTPLIPFISRSNYLFIMKIPKFTLDGLTEKPVLISGRYLNLMRCLIVPGLAFLLFVVHREKELFIPMLIVSALISSFLISQKQVYISRENIMIRHFWKKRIYRYSDVLSIKEIDVTSILMFNLSEPVIRLELRDILQNYTVYFFPRDNAFSELKNRLALQ